MKKMMRFLSCVGFLFIVGFIASCDAGSSQGGEVVIQKTTPTQTNITFDLSLLGNKGSIGLIDVNLFLNGEVIQTIEDLTQDKVTGQVFEELTPYQEYELEVLYDNGSDEIQRTSKKVTTHPQDITVDEIILNNEGDIYVGDIAEITIYFNNPDQVKIENITIGEEVINLAEQNVTTQVDLSLPCNFIGNEWQISVSDLNVKVNNLSVEYTVAEPYVLVVPIKGSMEFADLAITGNPSFIAIDTESELTFRLIGTEVSLYEIQSVTVNGSTYDGDQVVKEGDLVKVKFVLDEEGLNEVKLTEIVLLKEGVEIFSNLDLNLEIYVSSASEAVSVTTKEEFLAINPDEFKMYELANDIDFENAIVPTFNAFNGFLNGNDYSLKNITFDGGISSGLLQTNNGVIRNLKMKNITINLKDNTTKAGVIAAVNEGVIENVFVNGATISGTVNDAKIGGLVGENRSFIIDSYFMGALNLTGGANNTVGGLAGLNNGDINNSFTVINVLDQGSSIVGGIIGTNGLNGSLSNSYYYVGQVILSQHQNELGDVFTYEDLTNADLAWYRDTLLWDETIDFSIIDVSDIPAGYAEGTMGNPYEIGTHTSFMNIGKGTQYSYYQLTTDLDFTDIAFTPIASFSGILDGKGHVIRGIQYESTLQYTGVFQQLFGIVKDLTIEDTNFIVSGTNSAYVGILAGYSYQAFVDQVIISEDCSIVVRLIDGEANITSYVGGIVGYSSYTEIINSATSLSIDVNHLAPTSYGFSFTGGVVGYGNVTTLMNVASNSQITSKVQGITSASAYAGGIIGHHAGGLLKSVYSLSSVTLETTLTKSLVGAVYGGTTTSFYNREVFGLDTQAIYHNTILVETTNTVNKAVEFLTQAEMDTYNQSQPWGVLQG